MSSAAALRRLAARAAATAARHAFPRVAATSGGALAESATKASSAAASPFRSALRGFAAEAAPASAAASGVATGKVTQVRRCLERCRKQERELLCAMGKQKKRKEATIGKKRAALAAFGFFSFLADRFFGAKDALLSSSLDAKARSVMRFVA